MTLMDRDARKQLLLTRIAFERSMQEIRVVDVNRRTLEMFHAPDKDTLLRNLDRVFRDEMHTPFAEQLIDLWHGKLMQHREVVNYRLDGELINVLLQFSVLPGAEHDWRLVQVALIDITARKKAEAYLEYLGKHDVLTQLRNRAYFEDELHRVERKGPWPITVVAIDLNRLKQTNDQSGHAGWCPLSRAPRPRRSARSRCRSRRRRSRARRSSSR